MARAGQRTFTITELHRDGTGTFRSGVRFVWDAPTHTKPERGIQTPIEVNVVRSKLAGSTQPVHQVLSAARGAITFRGTWDDKWAGNGFAEATDREMAKLVGRGALVRVEWDGQSFLGTFEKYTPTHYDANRIGYELELLPEDDVSGGQRPLVPPSPTPTREHVNRMRDLTDSAQATQDAAIDLPRADSSYADLQDSLDDWETNTADLEAAESQRGIIASTTEQLRRQSGRFHALQDAAQSTIVDLAILRNDTVSAFDDAINELRFESWARELAAVARQMLMYAGQAERDTNKRLNTTPSRIYRPYAGQNIYAIAIDVYGSRDAWRTIAQANNLSTFTFNGTEQLIIPSETVVSQ